MKRLSRLLYASIPILLLLMLVAWTASNAGSYRSSWLGTFWVLNNLAPQYQPISDYGVSMYQLNDALRRLAHILIGFMAVIVMDRVPGACACVLAPQLRGQGATVPDGVPQGLSLEQPDSLEQLESLRAVKEPLGQARTRLPALGGHRHSSRRLSLCFDAATSRVNELSVTHEPRNRSMTLAKRKAAPSANRSSSSSSRTSRPRQTPPSGPGTRPATRRLDVPISPCTHCDF